MGTYPNDLQKVQNLDIFEITKGGSNAQLLSNKLDWNATRNQLSSALTFLQAEINHAILFHLPSLRTNHKMMVELGDNNRLMANGKRKPWRFSKIYLKPNIFFGYFRAFSWQCWDTSRCISYNTTRAIAKARDTHGIAHCLLPDCN